MVKLHGGQSGMSNSASWVYLSEDIGNLSFLKGGEFILSLASYNCSGLLINVGQYLLAKDITSEIVEFCDINKFPLFTMPWKVHLVDIMQDYCSLFLRERQLEDHLSAAFQSAIYQTQVPESILDTFTSSALLPKHNIIFSLYVILTIRQGLRLH